MAVRGWRGWRCDDRRRAGQCAVEAPSIKEGGRRRPVHRDFCHGQSRAECRSVGCTSDYWQGDEAKWQKTFSAGANAYFIDEIEFDDSSEMFQAQVSAAIADPATGEPIGAITFGVNVENLE